MLPRSNTSCSLIAVFVRQCVVFLLSIAVVLSMTAHSCEMAARASTQLRHCLILRRGPFPAGETAVVSRSDSLE
ncbi:hypothetical protein M011DRAFT_119099 [Sporormia fimetaria CBS 119925]|uniref:Uncharacterized protein n=1 Tax=Sporormia fimetaria CBS 119925 TaxID=1340428 RepID=A0A6A6VQS3_9PLEO|nr:hypothetical protein M011DRAFT_119099 [Sporormia fimetaria CBS 119925]